MMTREEQIRVLEEQLDYTLTQMRMGQDQKRFDYAQPHVVHLQGITQALMYLRSIPNPFGQIDPIPVKSKRRQLDLSDDDA